MTKQRGKMSVEKTKRPPNFESDVERYGTWGEALFRDTYTKSFNKKGYRLYDVTKDPHFQFRDIDFIVAKSSFQPDYYGGFDNGMNDEIMASPDFEKVEVKVDTCTIDTGNAPYEMVSHSQLGWCLRTKCDKVFFIIAKEEGENLTPLKGLWLDMNKWHDFIADKDTIKRPNYISSEDGIFDLLCKVDDLRSYGVVIGEKTFRG